MSLIPNIKWAEDESNIYLTIEVSDPTNTEIIINKNSISYSSNQNEKNYAIDLELFKQIDPSESSYSIKTRETEIILKKEEEKSLGWWRQLLLDRNRYKHRIEINWNLWKSADEE